MFVKYCEICKITGYVTCVAGRRKEGKSKWELEGEGTQSSRASGVRLSPSPPFRTPATQATVTSKLPSCSNVYGVICRNPKKAKEIINSYSHRAFFS